MDTNRPTQVKAFHQLTAFTSSVFDRHRLERFATANMAIALRATSEVARVTLLARAISPGNEARFDSESKELIRLGATHPAEVRILFESAIAADGARPHLPDVQVPPEVFLARAERVLRCLG